MRVRKAVPPKEQYITRSIEMTPAQNSSSRRNERLFLVLLVVAAAAIRFYRIGAQSLWVDEMLTLSVSSPKDGLNIWSYLKFNIHGPLHAFVVYLFQLVSASDGWLRVPSALAGAGAVAYFYLWICRWVGRTPARIGAVLMAVHPLHLYYSQELRNYSFLLLFGMMACYYFERVCERGAARDRFGYVLTMAFAALSNFTAAFLFVTHTILYFTRFKVRWRPITRWALISLAILVLISPWVYRIYTFIDVSDLVTPVAPGQLDEVERLRGKTTVTWTALPYAFYTYSVGFSLGPSTRELHENTRMRYVLRRHAGALAWVVVAFGGLFLWGLWSAVRGSAPWGGLLLYLLVPFVLTFALNWQNAKAFNVRYVLPGFGAFLCFVAIGLAAMPRRMGVAATAAVVVTLLVADFHYFFDGRYAREDVRGAVRYVEEHIETGECIFAPTVTALVQHYYRGIEDVRSVFNPPGLARAVVDRRLAPLFAWCNSLWYIRARPWVDDGDGYVLERLSSRYRRSQVIQFDGVELIHFEAKKGGP
jgi:hypothetical protein